MSEFSESCHIRTEDADDTKRRLRKARLAGVTFGPAHGWLTFVPYANLGRLERNPSLESFTHELMRLLAAPVLHYCCAEDHGWSFTLARPEGPTMKFACWWHPHRSIEREQLDLEALAPFVAKEALEPLLRPLDAAAAAIERPAHRFAELLGLPAYEWLSPHLAQHHTADLIARGGSKLGTRPASVTERVQVPPGRKLPIPRADVSAREAYEFVRPLMSEFEPAWLLVAITGNGRLTSVGRLEPRIGNWAFTYRKRRGPDFIRASLSSDREVAPSGYLRFHADAVPAPLRSDLPPATPLPADWLDSTEIVARIRRDPASAVIDDSDGLFMTFQAEAGVPPLWEVHCLRIEDPRGARSTTTRWAVDAISGSILLETFERKEGQRLIEARQRRVWQGGDWENLGISDD